MNITLNTLNVLRNFAQIAMGKDVSNIFIEAGNQLETLSESRGVMASARVAETFPVPFAIYDLNEFLMAVNLFRAPTFEFTEKYVTVKDEDGESEARYNFADPELIKVPIRKIKLDQPEIAFTLTEMKLEALIKAAHVFHAPNLAVISDGPEIRLMTLDTKNPLGNSFSISAGAGNGTPFCMVFDVELLNLLKGAYDVEISSKGISRFSHKSMDLKYFIALNAGYSGYGSKSKALRQRSYGGG
jgi:hypothetical protein